VTAVWLNDNSGKINAKDGEIQADFLSELGGFKFQTFYFLIKDFGEDQLGDAHIAHEELENNVVYGVGYSHGLVGMAWGGVIISALMYCYFLDFY
jgi:hypothetical protein